MIFPSFKKSGKSHPDDDEPASWDHYLQDYYRYYFTNVTTGSQDVASSLPGSSGHHFKKCNSPNSPMYSFSVIGIITGTIYLQGIPGP